MFGEVDELLAGYINLAIRRKLPLPEMQTSLSGYKRASLSSNQLNAELNFFCNP